MIKIIRFTSSNCAPCKALAPIFDQLKIQYTPRIQFQSIDMDFNKSLAKEKSINSAPTVIIEKNGVEIHRIVGVKPKMLYETSINSIL